jgi:hypothetical protein
MGYICYEVREGGNGLVWFWSIPGVLNRPVDMRGHGRAPTLKAAKVELQANWRKWPAWAKLKETA